MADELVTAENSGENSGRFQKGNPYRFPPKVSGNPGGRPRKPITEAYADMADQKYPVIRRAGRMRSCSRKASVKRQLRARLRLRARLLTGWKAKLFNQSFGITLPGIHSGIVGLHPCVEPR